MFQKALSVCRAAICIAGVGSALSSVSLAESPAAVTPSGHPKIAGPYEANWDSLSKHDPAPDWFRDDKFGIYFHWGVYSVPAFGSEWYPRHMHAKDSKEHKHHVEKYGPVDEFGYEDFVPQFTGENFDADEWCDLFQKSGAKFVGPVAEHHDGFAMWGSDWTPWNAVDRGPKKDIVGEMERAARKRGMKFVATFHTARNSLWLKNGNWSGHFDGAKLNFPESLGKDPERDFMYGFMPRDQFLRMWNGKLEEVIDRYHPDLIWFDTWLDEIPEKNRQEFAAYYFNDAAKRNQDVVITYKQEDMPQNMAVLDIEKGGLEEITDFAWLTDDTISLGSWCYTEDLKIKTPAIVLHSLVDIVSKNGSLILNLSPKADGTIPRVQRDVLLAIGDWLGKYGEAIYNTRPFVLHGHGPTKPGEGHFGGAATDIEYTAADVRYTRNGDTVYAIVLGKPAAGTKIKLEAFEKSDLAGKVKSVSVLGGGDVDFEVDGTALMVTAPGDCPDDLANVLKIVTQ